MKANFKIKKNDNTKTDKTLGASNEEKKDLTEEEFEDYIVKSGAAGSFMIFRSHKKDDELGIDEL